MSHAENPRAALPDARQPLARTIVRPVVIVVTAVLGWLAAAAGLHSPDANSWLVVLDVAVGLALVAGALFAPGSWPMRVLVGLVGLAWLAGSVVGAALLVHQGFLLVALITFPRGRPQGTEAWITLLVAVPVAVALVPQWLVALLFAAVAIRAVLRRSSLPAAYPFAAAGGVSLALGGSWLARTVDPFGYDPVVALVAYAVVLLLVAIGFPVALRATEDRSDLKQRVLQEEGLTGLAGLQAMLGDALGDRSIRMYRWDPAEDAYADAAGRPASPRPSTHWFPVMDGPAPLGAVAHRSAALDDERTAAAVADAMRLALLNLRGQEELQRQLAELEAARLHLLAAVDRERATVADRLRGEVVARIGEAAAALREASLEPPAGDAAEAVAVALGELEGTGGELMRLVDGLGPTGLGNGGLPRVLRDVAARSPLVAEIHAEPDAAGDVTSETALYYACLEAMANAAKHASAGTVRVDVRRRGEFLEAVVTDDGVGGADPGGSGLRGLADRLAACGGRLRVVSPPGAGTTVTAEVPTGRSAPTSPG
ncbi:MAG TPA: ATP-binding protein [Candidatus Limnocylindria bacterium]